jgi:hypothetical protein
MKHLNRFLQKQIINQLIPEKELLIELKKSYEISEIFFDRNAKFDTAWISIEEIQVNHVLIILKYRMNLSHFPTINLQHII